MSIDEIKLLVDFMQERGVLKFKAGDVEVEFGHIKSPDASKTLLEGETPSEKIANIRSAIEQLKQEQEAAELWSV